MEIDKKRLQELYEQEQSKTLAAKAYCEELGITYDETFRKKANAYILKLERSTEDEDLENFSDTKTNQYEKVDSLSNMPSAWSSEKNRFFSIEEYCDAYGLDKTSVKSSKLVSHNASHMVYNIAFFTEEEEAILDVESHFEDIIQKYIKPFPVAALKPHNTNTFDRLVYTDVHVAMDVQGKDGSPLYDGKWDKSELMRRLDVMIAHTKQFSKSNTLIIDDLGDFMDGLGGQTTRKGHELPQNMTDIEAFDLALEFKLKLIDALVGTYSSIVCNNITNDNHSGVFSYFVSSATKSILEQRYPGIVTVNSIKKFMHHYLIGNHTFVLCHGKDGGEMRFGLKPKLDAIQSEKIDQYCKENKLYNGNFIEFSKGDSHQGIYDDTTSNDFQYYNYTAFSPPSNWVKTNFKNSKSGFKFYNICKDENIKVAIPYFF